MKTKTMAEIFLEIAGPKPERAVLPSKVTITHDIFMVSERHKLLARAYRSAAEAASQAAMMVQATSRAKYDAYAALYELEVELDSMQKKAGIGNATRFYTIEDEEGEEHA